MSSCRERAPNYTNEEKICLFNIISKYKNIVECKKTDTITWKDKETAWSKVTEEFNAICPNLMKRSKKSIQKFYENKKKEVRKAAADNRMELIGTGGGNFKTNLSIDPSQDLLLNIINKKTVLGLSNNFDGDSNLPEHYADNAVNENLSYEDQQPTANSSEVHLLNTGQNNEENSIDNTALIINLNSPNIINELESDEVTTQNEIDWGNYKAKNLKTPISKKLTQPKKIENWTERRRPVQVLSSSHLTKQYSELASIKLELATLQRDVFIADTKSRQERDQIEFELKKKSLELDIEIKKIQLKKMFN